MDPGYNPTPFGQAPTVINIPSPHRGGILNDEDDDAPIANRPVQGGGGKLRLSLADLARRNAEQEPADRSSVGDDVETASATSLTRHKLRLNLRIGPAEPRAKAHCSEQGSRMVSPTPDGPPSAVPPSAPRTPVSTMPGGVVSVGGAVGLTSASASILASMDDGALQHPATPNSVGGSAMPQPPAASQKPASPSGGTAPGAVCAGSPDTARTVSTQPTTVRALANRDAFPSTPAQHPTAPAVQAPRRADQPADIAPVSLAAVAPYTIADGMQRYRVERKVGEGTYGEVYLGVEKATGEPVAIKKLKVLEQLEGLPITTLREISVLRSLPKLQASDVHFARLRDVAMAPDFHELHLVFDFVEHSFHGLMVQGVPFTDSDYRCVFRQVLRGLTLLHGANIVHRDIKPNNILVGRDGVVKLCDFGLAFSTTSNRQRVTPRLVALAYRPPEMLLEARSYSESVDIWSVGCMLAQAYLEGAPPFMRNQREAASSEQEQLALVTQAYRVNVATLASLLKLRVPGVEPLPEHVAPLSDAQLRRNLEAHLLNMARERKKAALPRPVMDVICRCLTLDPARRPSARELFTRFLSLESSPPDVS
jgi:serine/threonine protein kinase